MVDLQGQKAAVNGANTEKRVAEIIESLGGYVCQHRLSSDIGYYYDTLLIKNKPYTNMFGVKGKGDFFLTSIFLDKDIRIEVRSQNVQGSASEKIPTLFYNCKSMDTQNVIIVLEGSGHSNHTVKWLREKTIEEKEKNIKVMNLVEFENYMHNIFYTGVVH